MAVWEHMSLPGVCVCLTGTRFVPKAEERLLAVVHALLHRCYKMPFSNNAEVPASLKKELSGMSSGTMQRSLITILKRRNLLSSSSPRTSAGPSDACTVCAGPW